MFKEADGVVSMRRVLAFLFAISSIIILAIGAIMFSLPAIYGGGALLVAVIVLMFFTTWGDVAVIVAALKGR